MCIFSSAYGMFTKSDLLLVHKANLNRFQRTEITGSLFPDKNVIKMEMARALICQDRSWPTDWHQIPAVSGINPLVAKWRLIGPHSPE